MLMRAFTIPAYIYRLTTVGQLVALLTHFLPHISSSLPFLSSVIIIYFSSPSLFLYLAGWMSLPGCKYHNTAPVGCPSQARFPRCASWLSLLGSTPYTIFHIPLCQLIVSSEQQLLLRREKVNLLFGYTSRLSPLGRHHSYNYFHNIYLPLSFLNTRQSSPSNHNLLFQP